MSTNSMITREQFAPAFKNAELNKATNDIFTVAANMDKAQRKIATILGKLNISKAYQEDGFESVKDYAVKTFGMTPSTAEALTTSGTKFFNSKSPILLKLAEDTPIFNLNAIASLTDEEIEDGVACEAITPTTSQKDLQTVRNTYKANRRPDKEVKPKVLPKFKVDGVRVIMEENTETGDFLPKVENIQINEILASDIPAAMKLDCPVESLVKFDSDGKQRGRFFYGADGSFALVTVSKIEKSKKQHAKSMADMTKDEKIAYLQEQLAKLMNETK